MTDTKRLFVWGLLSEDAHEVLTLSASLPVFGQATCETSTMLEVARKRGADSAGE
jgi:hypothetical protein